MMMMMMMSDTDRQDSTSVASTGTSDYSQMCMHCQPAVTRRFAQLDTIRPAVSACIDWLCWPIVVNTSFSGMYESRLYQYRDRRMQRQRMLYSHLAHRRSRYDYTAQSYTCCKSRITRVIYDLNHCAYKTAGYNCKFVYKTINTTFVRLRVRHSDTNCC